MVFYSGDCGDLFSHLLLKFKQFFFYFKYRRPIDIGIGTVSAMISMLKKVPVSDQESCKQEPVSGKVHRHSPIFNIGVLYTGIGLHNVMHFLRAFLTLNTVFPATFLAVLAVP